MELSLQKTVIHFIRHGQVENPDKLRYGRLSGFHLSTEGRNQIEQTAHWLMRYPVHHMYVSPLERAQQSATILALAHPSAIIHLDDRILENKTAAELEGRSRSLGYTYPERPERDSETTLEVIDRFSHFCRDIVRRHPGEHVVAVSHGDPIGLWYHFELFAETNDPAKYLYPGYGSDWQFVYEENRLRLVGAYFPTRNGRIPT